MEYIYSVMVLQSMGKPITEEGIANIIKATGEQPDMAKIKGIVASLQGVDINEIIKSASQFQVAAPTTAAPAASKEEKKEAKKEEKEEKGVTEEQAAAGLSSLFGD
ncbi:MAG: 50S ribosomal protein P1 [Thermoplasmata archaeon]|jgi:large subunit ribosomal protein L12